MVRRLYIHLASESCNKMSCDDTGRHPVFRVCLRLVQKVQSRLFHWQTGYPSLWFSLSQSLK